MVQQDCKQSFPWMSEYVAGNILPSSKEVIFYSAILMA